MPSKKKNSSSKIPVNKTPEQSLINKAKKGDKKAIELLIFNNSQLIAGLANKYHNCFKTIDVSELAAEGNRGILEAIKHYNGSMSTKFSTYAWFWVVKNIQDYISSSIGLIGVPKNVMLSLRKVTANIDNQVKQGQTASLEDVSKKLDMDLEQVRELLTSRMNINNPLSLDGYIDGAEQEITLGDVVADKGLDSVKEIFEKIDDNLEINKWLEMLKPLEAEIIKFRYGFKDNKHHSLKEVADKLHILPGKVRDLEASAIFKLKKMAANKTED
jgi:RNA polymerase primary sigma factor